MKINCEHIAFQKYWSKTTILFKDDDGDLQEGADLLPRLLPAGPGEDEGDRGPGRGLQEDHLQGVLSPNDHHYFQIMCGTEPFPTDFRAKKYKLEKHFLTKVCS